MERPVYSHIAEVDKSATSALIKFARSGEELRGDIPGQSWEFHKWNHESICGSGRLLPIDYMIGMIAAVEVNSEKLAVDIRATALNESFINMETYHYGALPIGTVEVVISQVNMPVGERGFVCTKYRFLADNRVALSGSVLFSQDRQTALGQTALLNKLSLDSLVEPALESDRSGVWIDEVNFSFEASHVSSMLDFLKENISTNA